MAQTFDLQGHGRSESQDGIRGYAERFTDLVDDIQLIRDQVALQYSGMPACPA